MVVVGSVSGVGVAVAGWVEEEESGWGSGAVVVEGEVDGDW